MAANGNLIFQDTNKATFVGANSNVVIDTVHASFGVGVDVNGPTSNLHVVGNAYVTSDLEVGTANLFVDTVNSRVGVGTTSPNEKLDVYGTGMRIHDPAASPKIDLLRGGSSRNPDTDTFGASDYVDWRITANGPRLNFQNQYTGGNSGNLLNVMTLEHGTGNVGIGTTSPSSVFNTYGGSLWDGSSMASKVCATLQVGRGGGTGASANDTGFGGILEFRHHSDSRFVTIESVSEAAYSADIGLRFKTHGGAADGERMRIAGNGNVGIGTTIPQTSLQIKDETDTTGTGDGFITGLNNNSGNRKPTECLRLQGKYYAAGSGALLRFTNFHASGSNPSNDEYNLGGIAGFDYAAQWGGGLCFYTAPNTANGGDLTARMVITNTGNVGIGTTSPDSSLEVHGTGIHIDGTVLRSYSGVGAMTAGTWYKVCDFSALPATVAGVCAIRIKWGSGYLTNVGTYYWSGYASGIVSYNTYSDGNGTYSAAPQEPLTLNQHYHHRAAGAFEFMLDGDASGGSYGYQSIYIKSPQALSNLSLEVIAMPLRR